MKPLYCIFWALIIVISQTACSKKSNDTEITTGLSLPQRITAIAALPSESDTLSSLSQLSNLLLPAAYDDPDTDFSNDETVSYLFDNDIHHINSVNFLLCVFEKFGYQSQVNQGPYKAVIDYAECVEAFYPGAIAFNTVFKATILSARANNNSPHIVKIWLQEPGPENSNQSGIVETQTLIELSITRSPSESNPLGEFTIVYSDVEDASEHGGNAGEELLTEHGFYRSRINSQDEPVLQSINNPLVANTDSEYSAFSLLFHNPANQAGISKPGDSGAIRAEYHRDDTTIHSAILQFDQTRVLKGSYNANSQTIDTTTCLARDETQANIIGYTLYHRDDAMFRGSAVTAGQRVANTAGFSFNYNDLWGWISKYSYTLENDGFLPDGAIITRQLSDDSEQQLTVYLSTGKLRHNYTIETPLSNLLETDFIYFGSHPVSGVNDYWVLRLDTNYDFNVVKKRHWNGTVYIESDTYDDDANPDTPNVPVAASMVLQNGQYLYLYSRTYEFYRYRHDTTVAANNRSIELNGQAEVDINYDPLFPAGVTEVSLYCYYKCLRGGLSQTDVDTATTYQDLYYNYSFNPVPRTYTLRRNSYQVSLYDNLELVDVSQLDLNRFSLATLDLNYILTEPLPEPATFSQLFDSNSYYNFSTGHFIDGAFILVDGSGDLFTFDDAMYIEYQYLAAHDRYNTDPLTNPYHENIFDLFYVTAGSLAGLPFTWDESGNLVTEVNLNAGTPMSNAEGDYIVKGTWEYQYMAEKNASECVGLNLDNLLSVTDLILLTAADIPPVSFSVADKPLVEGEPAVKPTGIAH